MGNKDQSPQRFNKMRKKSQIYSINEEDLDIEKVHTDKNKTLLVK